QGRMLQKSSEDAHYCAALFRYFREFCIRYYQWACLISANNKYKIPIGEEVQFLQVYVSYKDTIFEPSNAIQHLTEFLNMLKLQYVYQKMLPILYLYTDGGPDHHCNYGIALKHDSISPKSENLFGM
ncbi:23341_t:CDS:2, partial [Gigaspora rosea]